MGTPVKQRELLASTTTPDGYEMTLSLHAGDHYIEVDRHWNPAGHEAVARELLPHVLRMAQ